MSMYVLWNVISHLVYLFICLLMMRVELLIINQCCCWSSKDFFFSFLSVRQSWRPNRWLGWWWKCHSPFITCLKQKKNPFSHPSFSHHHQTTRLLFSCLSFLVEILLFGKLKKNDNYHFRNRRSRNYISHRKRNYECFLFVSILDNDNDDDIERLSLPPPTSKANEFTFCFYHYSVCLVMAKKMKILSILLIFFSILCTISTHMVILL